jgi:hypothetical protein
MRALFLVVLLWLLTAPLSPCYELAEEPFENERLHIRFRPPAGWRLVHAGLGGDEPVEFWQDGEYGPRIQIDSFPYELSESSTLDDAQRELSVALKRQFPELEIIKETTLTHKGHPAIEVMATLPAGDTYYHVIQRCLFARRRIYILTCASFESSFLQDLPVFRACLESVEIMGDIYDPDRGLAKTGHLIPGHTLAMIAICLAASGFILRQVSIARLKRLGKWS